MKYGDDDNSDDDYGKGEIKECGVVHTVGVLENDKG